MAGDISRIDLHMHTTVSDGTDSPLEIIDKVREKGIDVFSVTDHDAIKGSAMVKDALLNDRDLKFITGAEFSGKDGLGKYHILAYAYDPRSEAVNRLVDKGHALRMKKLDARLDFLKSEFGFEFSRQDIEGLYAMDNPGKPHIGNLMVQYGFAPTKEEAIKEYINKKHFGSEYLSPEEIIKGITESGGIPVLAHPFYGSGDQLIIGDEMEERLKYLMEMGLKGVEAFYSGFTKVLTDSMLSMAEKFDLYITAGSDYHGSNKLVVLGDVGYMDGLDVPRGCSMFLKDALSRSGYGD